MENLALFYEGESGVELVTVGLPAPPPLYHVAGDQVRIHLERARYAGPEAVAAYRVFSGYKKV